MALRFPGIPDSADLKTLLPAIKETIEIWRGLRGPKDKYGKYPNRVVTASELAELVASDPTITTTLITAVSASIGFGAPTEKTISSGIIAVTGSTWFRFHTVDTESDAATDDLTTISGGAAGEVILLKAESGDRTIVLKNSATLILGVDFSMDNIGDTILLVCISSGVWYQLSRFNAGT